MDKQLKEAVEECLVGYSVFPLKKGFAPQIPYSEELGTKTLAQAHKTTGIYSYDISKLLYFIESQDLGKQPMLLTLMRGYVEYGANAQDKRLLTNPKNTITQLMADLDQQATFA